MGAGLQPGDRIVSVDGQPITGWEGRQHGPRQGVGHHQVVVERSGTQIPVTVDLAPVSYPVYDDKGQPTGATTPDLPQGAAAGRLRPVARPRPPHTWDITTASVGALLTMPQRMYDLAVTLVTNGERSQESPVSRRGDLTQGRDRRHGRAHRRQDRIVPGSGPPP